MFWGFFWPTAIKRLGFNAMTRAQQVYLKVVCSTITGEAADTCSDVFEVCWKGIVTTID